MKQETLPRPILYQRQNSHSNQQSFLVARIIKYTVSFILGITLGLTIHETWLRHQELMSIHQPKLPNHRTIREAGAVNYTSLNEKRHVINGYEKQQVVHMLEYYNDNQNIKTQHDQNIRTKLRDLLNDFHDRIEQNAPVTLNEMKKTSFHQVSDQNQGIYERSGTILGNRGGVFKKESVSNTFLGVQVDGIVRSMSENEDVVPKDKQTQRESSDVSDDGQLVVEADTDLHNNDGVSTRIGVSKEEEMYVTQHRLNATDTQDTKGVITNEIAIAERRLKEIGVHEEDHLVPVRKSTIVNDNEEGNHNNDIPDYDNTIIQDEDTDTRQIQDEDTPDSDDTGNKQGFNEYAGSDSKADGMNNGMAPQVKDEIVVQDSSKSIVLQNGNDDQQNSDRVKQEFVKQTFKLAERRNVPHHPLNIITHLTTKIETIARVDSDVDLSRFDHNQQVEYIQQGDLEKFRRKILSNVPHKPNIKETV